jgi:hypothetical protein
MKKIDITQTINSHPNVQTDVYSQYAALQHEA